MRDIVAMDNKQAQFEANNNATRDDLAQSSYIQTIQLIDVHGCPTDSNIMGQLVKLDAAGRRYLAPFDAFKFPASDVVFFRALITTCVAECQIPTNCQQLTQSSATSSELEQRDNMAEFTNRSVPIVDLQQQQQQDATASTRDLSSSTTTTLTTEFSSAPTSTTISPLDSTSMLLKATSMGNQQTPPTPLIQTNRDSTTTVAGFGSTKPPINSHPSNWSTISNLNSLSPTFGFGTGEGEKFALDGLSSLTETNENQLNFPLSLAPTTPTSLLQAVFSSPQKQHQQAHWLQQQQQQYHSNNYDSGREPESRSSISPPDLPPIEILNDLQRELLVKLLKETRRRVAIDLNTPSELASANVTANTTINTHFDPINLRNFDNETTTPMPATSSQNNESLVAQIDKLVSKLESAAKRAASQRESGQQQQQPSDIKDSSNNANNELFDNEVTTINVAPDSNNNTLLNNSFLNYTSFSPEQAIASVGEEAAKTTWPPSDLANSNSNEAINTSSEIQQPQQFSLLEKALDETLQEHLKKLERIARQSSMLQAPNVTDQTQLREMISHPEPSGRKRRDVADARWNHGDSESLYKHHTRWDPSLDSIIQASLWETQKELGLIEDDHVSNELTRVKRQVLVQAPTKDDSLLVQSIKILDRMDFDEGQQQSRSSTDKLSGLKKQRQFVAKNSLVTNQSNKQKQQRLETIQPSDKMENSNLALHSNDDESDANDTGSLSTKSNLAHGHKNQWTTLTLLLVIASASFFVIQFLLIFTFAYWSPKLVSKPRLSHNHINNNNSSPPMMIISSQQSPYLDLGYNSTPSPNSSHFSMNQNSAYLCSSAESMNPRSPSLLSSASSSLLLAASNSNHMNGRRTTSISNYTNRPAFGCPTVNSKPTQTSGRRQLK